MAPFSARYFPGDRPVPATARVTVDAAEATCEIRTDELRRSFALAVIEVEPRLGDAPRVIALPDGGRLETQDHEAADQLTAMLGRRVTNLHRFESARPAVIGAIAGVAALLWLAVVQGLPGLAWVGAALMPPLYSERLSDYTLRFLDRRVLGASELPVHEQERLRGLFAEIQDQAAGYDLQLLFRAGSADGVAGGIGPNALALPSGTVIVTDELVTLAESDDELAAVLAHEAGHVVHRHGLRSLIQSVGVTVLLGALTGDVSGMNVMAQGLPAVLTNAAYSRRFEVAADRYARERLTAVGRDPAALGAFLLRLEAHVGGSGLGYLSSHPPARKRAAAGGD
jgi:Zn-dependent protease with chaperone function